MKRIIGVSDLLSLCIIILVPFVTKSQTSHNEYSLSSAEIEYYKSFNPTKLFLKLDNQDIQKHTSLFIKSEDDYATNPFTSIVSLSKYEATFDLALRDNESKYEKGIISKQIYSDRLDSLILIYGTKKIGPALQKDIISADTIGNICAIVFKAKGPEVFEENLWAALSFDKGKKWNIYYLSLTQNKYYHIKANQKVKLLADKFTLQLEATLLEITTKAKNIGDTITYKILKDNILLKINIDDIIKDSDNDGLTDIYEMKTATNINSRDTDGDSLNDDIDKNPLKKNVKDDYSQLGNYLLEKLQFLYTSEYDTISNPTFENQKVPFIVMDEPKLIGLIPPKNKFTILTKIEYWNYLVNNIPPSNLLFVSPLFPIDKQPNFYKINIDCEFGRISFIVKWDEKGWFIKLLADK
jgi:hypothetical protein